MKSQRSKSLHEAEELVAIEILTHCLTNNSSQKIYDDEVNLGDIVDDEEEDENLIQVGLQLREEQEIPGKARSVSFNGVRFPYSE